MILAIGLASAAFHAFMLYWLHAVDLAAIFLFTGFLLSANLCNAKLIAPDWFGRAFLLLAAGGALLAFFDPRLGYAGLAVQGVGVLRSAGRIPASGPRRELAAAAIVIGLALVTLVADHGEFACTRGALEHIRQPHSFWHIFSASSLVFFYRYERAVERAVRSGMPSVRAA